MQHSKFFQEVLLVSLQGMAATCINAIASSKVDIDVFKRVKWQPVVR